MTEQTLSDKIEKGGCIESCLCNKGDADYNYDLRESKDCYFLDVEDVKEAVRKLKEEIKEDRWITNDDKELFNKFIEKFFGDKLI